jgi:hypothetical protein
MLKIYCTILALRSHDNFNYEMEFPSGRISPLSKIFLLLQAGQCTLRKEEAAAQRTGDRAMRQSANRGLPMRREIG